MQGPSPSLLPGLYTASHWDGTIILRASQGKKRQVLPICSNAMGILGGVSAPSLPIWFCPTLNNASLLGWTGVQPNNFNCAEFCYTLEIYSCFQRNLPPCPTDISPTVGPFNLPFIKFIIHYFAFHSAYYLNFSNIWFFLPKLETVLMHGLVGWEDFDAPVFPV